MLPILPRNCRQCAQFLTSTSLPAQDLHCGSCLKTPPPFDATYALFPYFPPIIGLIRQLKFKHQLTHAKALAELLLQQIKTDWYKHKPLPDLLIPVPLHPYRLRERGFNQAIEIAKPIAKALDIPLDLHGMQRIKPTAVQSSLPAKERGRNMANAFALNRDYSALSVCLIDDVITTGHTISACARLLKQNGAKHIDVWCCARRG
jgi:ComF family protein